MKIHLRDVFWLFVFVSIVLAWSKDSAQRKAVEVQLQRDKSAAESRLKLRDAELQMASSEANVLSEEVRRLRAVVKSSIDDQRHWFAIEVEGKKLVAINLGTSKSNLLTMDMVQRIEAETGLEATRLRHFLTPISQLQLDRSRP